LRHVFVNVEFTSQAGDRSAEAEAMVDTGATYTVIPGSMAKDLRLSPNGSRRVKTASGEMEMPMSWVLVDFAGHRGPTYVLIGDQVDQVLIGVITLEEAGLAVDPSSGELRQAPAYLY
jgi:clan AA aspartic protease